MSIQVDQDEPRVRGVLFGSFVTWYRSAFGDAAFQQLLARLGPEDRAIAGGTILPVQTFPFRTYMNVIDTAEALALEQGVDVHTFRRRVVAEGGGSIVRTFYKLLLLLASPTNLVKQLPMFYERALLGGKCEIVRNERGKAVIRYSGPAVMERYMRDSRVPIITFLLEQNGAKSVLCRIENAHLDAKAYAFDLAVEYR